MTYSKDEIDDWWQELCPPPHKMSEEQYKIFAEEYNRIMEHAPSAINFLAEHAKDARWDILTKAFNIMESGFRSRMS